MKRISIIFVLALAVSCSKEASVPVSDNIVLFGADFLESKAYVETTSSVLETRGFYVCGFTDKSKKNTINAVARWNAGKGCYLTDEEFFWTTKESMTFYGVYPPVYFINYDNGKGTLNYTCDGQTDLCVAVGHGSAETLGASPVPMHFAHRLSLLNFFFKSENPEVVCRVTDILVDTPSVGSYSCSDGQWLTGPLVEKPFAAHGGILDVGSSEIPAEGSMTVIPSEIKCTVLYQVLSADKSVVLDDVKKDFTFNTTIGMTINVHVKLPFTSAEKIKFTVSVNPWGTNTVNPSFE